MNSTHRTNWKTRAVLSFLLAGICGAASFATPLAWADESQWAYTQIDQLKGVTPSGIFEVMERYPNEFVYVRQRAAHQALASLPVHTLSHVAVTLGQWEWKGATICPPGDPRLTRTGVSQAEACWNGGDTDPTLHSHCEASAVAYVERDPCAAN